MATKFLKQYEILFKKAKVDLHSAKILLRSFNEGDVELELDVIFFHLQQCSEKLIKVVLDLHTIKFPHTHDLKNLIHLINENSIDTTHDIKLLIPLTEFAVEGRYAIIHDDLDDADKYIELLDRLLKFVQKKVINDK